MKLNLRKHIIVIVSLAAFSAAQAQNTFRSAYFIDGYNHRNNFNPAFAAERSYFSMPVIGDLRLNLLSNMGVSTFLFPAPDGLTTFMSPDVSADEFLGKLRNNNRINMDVNTSLLSFGARGKKGYFSFDLNVRATADINLPYALFDFMKNTGKSQYYDISGLAARADARVELALGYSRRIADIVNFGARIKALVGVAGLDARIDNMKVAMTGDQWSIHSSGTLKASCGLIEIPTKGESGSAETPAENDLLDFSNIETVESFSADKLISGYGGAIDLGVEIQLIPGLNLSAAICDIGYMAWRNSTVAKTGDQGWIFDGFNDISFDEDSDNSISEQFKALGDDLADMVDFRRASTNGKRGEFLACTLNIGAEYVMPFYSGLSAGFLYSTTLDGPHTRHEGRLYANLEPCSWFSFGVNGGATSYGATGGFILGLHTAGFNFFIGTDHIMTKFAPTGTEGLIYPYGKLHTQINFGIGFNVGARRSNGSPRPIINL